MPEFLAPNLFLLASAGFHMPMFPKFEYKVKSKMTKAENHMLMYPSFWVQSQIKMTKAGNHMPKLESWNIIWCLGFKAVHGCTEWSRPYGCGLAFAIVHWGSTNYTVLELPLFCVELLWRIYGEFTRNIIQAWHHDLILIHRASRPLITYPTTQWTFWLFYVNYSTISIHDTDRALASTRCHFPTPYSCNSRDSFETRPSYWALNPFTIDKFVSGQQ